MSPGNKAILSLHPGEQNSGTTHRNVHSPMENPNLDVSSGIHTVPETKETPIQQ